MFPFQLPDLGVAVALMTLRSSDKKNHDTFRLPFEGKRLLDAAIKALLVLSLCLPGSLFPLLL
jgi:hypothetical protein